MTTSSRWRIGGPFIALASRRGIFVLMMVLCACREAGAPPRDSGAEGARVDSEAPPGAKGEAGARALAPPPGVIQLSGRLRDIVRNLRRVGVQSTPYRAPTAEELGIAREAFGHLIAMKPELAAQDLARIGYEVVRLEERRVIYYLVRENQLRPIKGWGFFVFNPRARRPYVLEVPHPRNDRLTDRQGIRLMTSLGARALLLSTTYRCATREASECEGKTAACSKAPRQQPYSISDMSHTTRSIFHVAHETFFAHSRGALFLQFHGFARRPGRRYHLIISDGTRLPGSARTHSNRLVRLLRREIDQPRAVVSCNSWKRRRLPLCGTQNVQGRAANGSPDPCRVEARRSSNRYIHIEQSWDARTRGGDIEAQALLRALRKLVRPIKKTPARRTLPWVRALPRGRKRGP